MTTTKKTEVVLEPREYTKEEISRFTDDQLETLASKLNWPVGNAWTGRVDLARFKTRGFPNRFGNKKLGSRREFLIKRLASVGSQTKWNPAAAEAAKKRKEAQEAAEAKKPKVATKVHLDIQVELKDARPKGHTFTIERKNGKLKCQQKEDGKGPRVGKSVCSTRGEYNLQDFEDAIDLATNIVIPTQKKGKASLVAFVALEGRDRETALTLECHGEEVWIFQTQESRHMKDESKWHFRVSDLRAVVAAFKKRYTFHEVITKEAAA